MVSSSEIVLVATVSSVIGGFTGILFKAFWSLISGSSNFKLADCERRRADCCLPAIKKEVENIGTRLKETEKQLDLGRESFEKIMDKISNLEKKIEGLIRVWEYSMDIKQKEWREHE